MLGPVPAPDRSHATPTLRPYQTATVAAVHGAWAEHRSALVVLPTGTGKTVVFADIARRTVEQGGRALILAHRTELLDQAIGKLRAVGIDPALEQGASRAGSAPVVVASVQTLRAARLARLAQAGVSLVVVDEAHHSMAASYRAILGAFPAARVLGVTATPDRLDGAALGEVFDTVAYRYELRDAIRDGWLARIDARRIKLDVDLDRVKTKAGDLDAKGLAAEYMADAAIEGVVKPLVEQAAGRRTILFAVTVEHAEALAAALNERGGRARAVSGETPTAERAALVAAFRQGELETLVNCQLYTEGFDCPEVEVVALARPTKSRALFAQMIGRGTRPAPGKASCLVLDFTGNTKRHRLITPADALAGTDVDPDVLDRAAEIEGDVLEAIDAAARDALADQARVKASAVVRYSVEAVDLLGIEIERGAAGAATATERQREVLDRAGMPAPVELTKQAASQLIDAIVMRRQLGLCTVKQARLLKRSGIDAKAMTMEQAGVHISRLRARWGFARKR